MTQLFQKNRRNLQPDALSGFLPSSAILMADPDAASHEAPQDALPEEVAPERLSYPKTPSGLLFFVSQDDINSPGARELLHKMVGALGLSAETARIEELSDAQNHQNSDIDFGGNLAVVLGEDAAYRLGLFDGTGVRALVSHSLSSLLADAGLKRESWSHLQMAAREAGWKIPARG